MVIKRSNGGNKRSNAPLGKAFSAGTERIRQEQGKKLKRDLAWMSDTLSKTADPDERESLEASIETMKRWIADL